MDLAHAALNKTYNIAGMRDYDHRTRHLLRMGFTVGSKVKVLALAPAGDTALIALREFVVAIRIDVTAMILVDDYEV